MDKKGHVEYNLLLISIILMTLEMRSIWMVIKLFEIDLIFSSCLEDTNAENHDEFTDKSKIQF